MYLIYHLGWLVYDTSKVLAHPSAWTILAFALGVMWILRGIGRLMQSGR